MSVENEEQFYHCREDKENDNDVNIPPKSTKKRHSARASSQRKSKKRRIFSEDSRLDEEEERLLLAIKYKDQGNKFYAEQEYDRAIDAYSSAISLDPMNPVYPGNRAAAKLMVGQYVGATADCELALARDPSYSKSRVRAVRAYIGLGDVYRARLHVEFLTQTGGFDVGDLRQLVKGYVSLVSALDDALTNERIEDARESLLQAMKIAPASPKLWFAEKTIKLFTAALGHKSTADAPSVLPGIRADLQNMVKTCNEESLEHLLHYGNMLLSCAFISEAKLLFSVAHELNVFDPILTTKIKLVKSMERCQSEGAKSYSSKNYEQAVSCFEEALLLDRTNSAYNGRIYFRRAAAHMSMGQFTQAINDCTSSLRNIPSYHKARIRRAHVYIQMKNYTEAIRDLTYVYKVAPTPTVQREIKAAQDMMNQGDFFRNQKRSEEPKSYFESRKQKPSSHKNPERKSPKLKQRRVSLDMNSSHYQVLGLDTNATSDSIRKAYKRRALKYHPDKNPSPQAETKFKRVAEAYRVLKSPGQRRVYDAQTGRFHW